MTPPPDADRDLVDRVGTGDLNAYGELFARHRVVAYWYATQFTRDPSQCDDLVADAFMRVLNAIRSGSRPLAFRAYLLTAVRSAAYEAARRNARCQPAEIDTDKPVQAMPVVADHADAVVDRLAAHPVRRAFAALPRRWRDVLWASAVQGRSSIEIGEMFALTPNAASALTYRARKALRATLGTTTRAARR
ncbi:sigma-70 region 2 domain protein [Alloactinosynnema sp. L-07]|uniref:RNA polymerase sigma factor n=1 Tax=Alloactinosynnema sp. L-07 TaxID=1653480 RepID=UPI00065EF0E3|nr:sigma-70 family RNA polymerase sigma factor [Alloactinosynnema sp. L-07]CRK59361.1 sigma-70 region 2 domain protein [Alloactinosynnema sp. L-07]